MNLIKLNTNVKKIVNVYQYEYINKKSTGFGDFLRGCFCLYQVCKILNIEFDIDISNHLISKFLLNVSKVENIDYNNIKFMEEQNRDSTNRDDYEDSLYNINEDYLNTIILLLNKTNKSICAIFNYAFPLCNKHKLEECQFLREKFKPSLEMEDYIKSTLNELKLEKNEYSIIHIRTGDNSITTNTIIDLQLIYKIEKLIDKNIDNNKKYLIISDCNIIKLYFKNRPNFYFIIKDICHLGGEKKEYYMHNENLYDMTKNTMLDFYLMSNSNSILSLSIYSHISGFSKYCAVMYNIPFSYAKIY